MRHFAVANSIAGVGFGGSCLVGSCVIPKPNLKFLFPLFFTESMLLCSGIGKGDLVGFVLVPRNAFSGAVVAIKTLRKRVRGLLVASLGIVGYTYIPQICS